LTPQTIKKIRLALRRDDIKSFNGLFKESGIGEKTLIKAYQFVKNSKKQLSFNL